MCCNKPRALPAGRCVCVCVYDMLAAIYHHRVVFNPSRSVSLWPYTCASSYLGLCRSNSLSAAAALSAARATRSCFVQTSADPSCVPLLHEWFGWIYEGLTQTAWGVLDKRQSTSLSNHYLSAVSHFITRILSRW